MINNEFKLKVIEALKEARGHFYGSDAKYATSINISGSQYSRIKNGETERVLSDANWIMLARTLELDPEGDKEWNIAKTPVYQFVITQLEICQREGLSSLLCDFSDIGKTVAAKDYVSKNKNAVRVDCSQLKSKQRLIRGVAKQFGIGGTGRYYDVYDNLVYYIKTISKPIIIWDEVGDVHQEALLEIKAIWNGTQHCCSHYMIGADGLQARMMRGIDNKKVGYTELFSRFGKRYGKVIPLGDESKKVLEQTALMIIKANAPEGSDYNKILRNTMGEDGRPSLRRIYNELAKHR